MPRRTTSTGADQKPNIVRLGSSQRRHADDADDDGARPLPQTSRTHNLYTAAAVTNKHANHHRRNNMKNNKRMSYRSIGAESGFKFVPTSTSGGQQIQQKTSKSSSKQTGDIVFTRTQYQKPSNSNRSPPREYTPAHQPNNQSRRSRTPQRQRQQKTTSSRSPVRSEITFTPSKNKISQSTGGDEISFAPSSHTSTTASSSSTEEFTFKPTVTKEISFNPSTPPPSKSKEFSISPKSTFKSNSSSRNNVSIPQFKSKTGLSTSTGKGSGSSSEIIFKWEPPPPKQQQQHQPQGQQQQRQQLSKKEYTIPTLMNNRDKINKLAAEKARMSVADFGLKTGQKQKSKGKEFTVHKKPYKELLKERLLEEEKSKGQQHDGNDNKRSEVEEEAEVIEEVRTQGKTDDETVVDQVLMQLNLSEYQDNFKENHLLTIDDLLLLTTKDMKDIGLNRVGERNRLKVWIQKEKDKTLLYKQDDNNEREQQPAKAATEAAKPSTIAGQHSKDEKEVPDTAAELENKMSLEETNTNVTTDDYSDEGCHVGDIGNISYDENDGFVEEDDTDDDTDDDTHEFAKYFKMLSVGVPMRAVKNMAFLDGYDPEELDNFKYKRIKHDTEDAPWDDYHEIMEGEHAIYFKMLGAGVPLAAVYQRMQLDGWDIENDPDAQLDIESFQRVKTEIRRAKGTNYDGKEDNTKHAMYISMLHKGMTMKQVKRRMESDGEDPIGLDSYQYRHVPDDDGYYSSQKPTNGEEKVEKNEIKKYKGMDDGSIDESLYKKYFKMLSVGVPLRSVKQHLYLDGLEPSVMDNFQYRRTVTSIARSTNDDIDDRNIVDDDTECEKIWDTDEAMYYKMLSAGVPIEAVRQRMSFDGYDDVSSALDFDLYQRYMKKTRKKAQTEEQSLNPGDSKPGQNKEKCNLSKYFQMLSEGYVMRDVKDEMIDDGLKDDPDDLLDVHQYKRIDIPVKRRKSSY